jgi:hypothetical protein
MLPKPAYHDHIFKSLCQFGAVGSRNIPGMTDEGLRVWTMDVLGQGKSWPTVDPAPGGM